MTDPAEIVSTGRKRTTPITYAVRVKTTAEWYGSVEARSIDEAKHKAQQQFDDGELTQYEEEIVAVIAYRERPRIGSWDTFERRFKPIGGPDGATRQDMPSLSSHRRCTGSA